MTKFSGTRKSPMRTNKTGAVRSTGRNIDTHEGGEGFERTPESELFLLAVANMVGEATFYEAADDRDARYGDLIHTVTASNPSFIAGKAGDTKRIGLVGFLRNTMQMRSASIVMAAEYVAAGGPNGRTVVDSALQRADEPAELLGYWMSEHGRSLPAALKRGIADAVKRLYTERSTLRYDGLSRGIRMADVIELIHPKPADAKQSELFKYLLDKRHHDGEGVRESLKGDRGRVLRMLRKAADLESLPADERRNALKDNPDALADAGFSWERLSGWLPGGMDAQAWEAVIPSMGYMALLRNLRNFDEAEISKKATKTVRARLEDRNEVLKSRQFPYRFWSAYRNAPSLNWASSLETAMEISVESVPELPGRTLLLIDTSGSMQSGMSGRSVVMRYEVAALFAAAQAKRAATADVAIFGDFAKVFPVKKNQSVLRYVESVGSAIGSVGHGTNTYEAIESMYNGHDRVIVFTDEQARDSVIGGLKQVPLIYTFNLAGYRAGSFEVGQKGRYAFGGFTDAAFRALAVLENESSESWPF